MIRAWITAHLLSVLAVVAVSAFFCGIGFHRLVVKAGERDAAVAVVAKTAEDLGVKDKRDTKRATARAARHETEADLSSKLEREIASHPSYDGVVPVDGVRILNGY